MALLQRLNAMYQRAKNIIYAVQALLLFVAAMITIAIFTKNGRSDGRITYFFALCFITLPFLIYQTAVPTFQRSKRFANAYAHAIIDVILSILWLAALIGEAVWAKDGTQAGKGFKDGDSICQVFGYGSTDKCHLGQVTMWFGVAIFLTFILTSSLSIYAVFYFRKNGILPGDPVAKDAETIQSDDLEFTGASPHETYEPPTAHQQQPQEMQQQPPPPPPTIYQNQTQTHLNSDHLRPNPPYDNDNINDNDYNVDSPPPSAMLPPKPIYPKAPRTPLQQDFEPLELEMSYYGAGMQPLDPRDDNAASNSHYRHQEGLHYPSSSSSFPSARDYALPPRRAETSLAELPTLKADAAFRPGPGFVAGGNLRFPAGDYSR